jgi:hypothetical protein
MAETTGQARHIERVRTHIYTYRQMSFRFDATQTIAVHHRRYDRRPCRGGGSLGSLALPESTGHVCRRAAQRYAGRVWVLGLHVPGPDILYAMEASTRRVAIGRTNDGVARVCVRRSSVTVQSFLFVSLIQRTYLRYVSHVRNKMSMS